ncbi:MAG: Crp/Fnr family transcriptional regulator, partial [Bacteroidia bacterium]
MINKIQTDTLIQFTDKIHKLSPQAAEEFATIWQPLEAKRKELLTVAGEPERYLYFVLEGVQRVYYLDDNNREATLVFTYAPSFGGVLDALLLQQPSAYYYETLTPSVLLRAPVLQLLQLMEQHHDIEVMVRKGVTAATSGVLGRLVELQCYSAEDRYK